MLSRTASVESLAWIPLLIAQLRSFRLNLVLKSKKECYHRFVNSIVPYSYEDGEAAILQGGQLPIIGQWKGLRLGEDNPILPAFQSKTIAENYYQICNDNQIIGNIKTNNIETHLSGLFTNPILRALVSQYRTFPRLVSILL